MFFRQWQTLNAKKKAIFLLLTVFLLKGLLYAFLFPLWQAPDEPGHYQAVINKAAAVLDAFKLDPLNTPNLKYANKPSLYYRLSAIIILPFKNSSVITRAYVLRFFNVLLSLGVIYLAYKTAHKLLPNQPLIALATPFFITMLPMFSHTGSAINSDNLANLMFAAFIYLSVLGLIEGFTLPRSILMVGVVALGLLTKRTTFTAVLLLLSLPLLTYFRKPVNRDWLKQNSLRLAAFFLIILLLLPYINFMALKFGQVNIFSFTQEIFNVGGLSLRDKLTQPLTIFTMTFWGDFGWADVPLAFNYYAQLNKVWWLPVIGLLVILWQTIYSKKISFNRAQTLALLFLLLTLLLVLFTVLVFQPLWVKSLNWMPQARYAWTVIIPLAFFFSFGTILPFRDKIAPFIILTLMATVYEAAVLFRVVIPHYYASLFSFTGVKPANFYSQSLFKQLAELGVVNQTQQAIFLRPGFLNSSLLYLALFAFVYIALTLFFYQAVKAAQQEQ